MTSPTQSPGMSELRGLLEKATKGPWETRGPTLVYGNLQRDILGTADKVASTVTVHDAELIVAAVNSLPTLLDDLAAAQGEIERLRGLIDKIEALSIPGGKRLASSRQTFNAIWLLARSALTLKSEEKQGLSSSLDLKPTPVASEPKNSDVQQVKP
jgi:ABC-type transporter Mla subunit MlaD